MITIKKTTVNYTENPIGIPADPRFSWIIGSDEMNVIQKSFELIIAKDHEFEQIVYSKKEMSDRSTNVKVSDLKLEHCSKYYYKVRIEAESLSISDYSPVGSFITELTNKEWRADFITAECMEDKMVSKGTYLRKKLQIRREVKEAYACTTALGLYQLWINGQKVGKDELTPGWTSYNKHLTYQMYEITDYLIPGGNCIGATLGAGWYKGVMGFMGEPHNYGDQTAFLAQILIRYKDGSSELVLSDEHWEGIDSPVLFSEIYDGEVYDARKEVSNWCDYSETDDNQSYSRIDPVDHPKHADGYKKQKWHKAVKVAFDKSVLYPQYGAKPVVVSELPVSEIIVTPEGDTVLDFGQNLTGRVKFKVKGKAGDKVELNCFEVLDSLGNVYTDNLRAAKETVIYYCKDDKEAEYHPFFTFQGFRYARLAAYPGTVKKENFTAQVIHSDMEQTGDFECSNPDINQLQHNILWGLKGNFLDVPTDCPQRNERLGWTGDAQIFCRTASYLMNTYLFFEKWLIDVKKDQTPEGGVPHVVPDILTNLKEEIIQKDWLLSHGTHSAAAWADAAVINPWTLYLTYGDEQILKDQYDSMKAWIEFMRKHSVGNIWDFKLQFGDWVALDAEEGSYFGATPNDLTCTAYYAYSTEIFSKIAEILGKQEDHNEYLKLHNDIVTTFQNTFFDILGTMTADTQTAHILALYFNLVTKQHREKTIKRLLELLEKENGHLVTGFVGTPYFTHALSQNGQLEAAYQLLLKDDFPSWLYQVKMGATTVWEHWDGIRPDGTMWSADMNSFNHYAYGAIGEWLYRVVAGIEIDEAAPGYKHSIIAPQPGGGLTYAKGIYQSVYGMIISGWSMEGDSITLDITIPHNTTASIRIKDADKLLSTAGLEFNRVKGVYSAEAGSGRYTIIYRKRSVIE